MNRSTPPQLLQINKMQSNAENFWPATGLASTEDSGKTLPTKELLSESLARARQAKTKLAPQSSRDSGRSSSGHSNRLFLLIQVIESLLSAALTASWCNGSTKDSGSFCRGSSPCEAAKPRLDENPRGLTEEAKATGDGAR